MIQYALAQALRDAGLRWAPQNGDWFSLFEEGDVWLIAASGVELGIIDGAPALLFHGASEWALDTVWAGEATWLPSATQLHAALLQTLGAEATITLDATIAGVRCRVQFGEWRYEASAIDLADAYGSVLLAVLQNVRA